MLGYMIFFFFPGRKNFPTQVKTQSCDPGGPLGLIFVNRSGMCRFIGERKPSGQGQHHLNSIMERNICMHVG